MSLSIHSANAWFAFPVNQPLIYTASMANYRYNLRLMVRNCFNQHNIIATLNLTSLSSWQLADSMTSFALFFVR